jgi:uridine phosphorylase
MSDVVETIHLHPTTELAERVLLPGDPGRALALAQWLLEKPLMFNHNRGLWGYTGKAPDGELLTVQSTGMGGPSAAIVLHELATLGAKRAIRVGTCGALNGNFALGELLVAGEAIAADGTSRALGAGERVSADPTLTRALEAAGGDPKLVVSTDLFYEPDPRREHGWRAAGAAAVEMEAATLFAVGDLLEIPVGCVLAVSDLLHPDGRERIGVEDLEQAAQTMGQVALAALS